MQLLYRLSSLDFCELIGSDRPHTTGQPSELKSRKLVEWTISTHIGVSRPSAYSCHEAKLQNSRPFFSRSHFRCRLCTQRVAVLRSVIRGVALSIAMRRSSKPSVSACESMESGTLITRSILPPWSSVLTLGSRLTSGLYTKVV